MFVLVEGALQFAKHFPFEPHNVPQRRQGSFYRSPEETKQYIQDYVAGEPEIQEELWIF